LDKLFHHRLRGSANPVLTATGFVNGKGQFLTHHRIDTHRPITKKLSQVITSATTTGELLGTWVKYNQNYFYLCPFWGNLPTGQMRPQIFTHNGSNDAESRKHVPFGFFIRQWRI